MRSRKNLIALFVVIAAIVFAQPRHAGADQAISLGDQLSPLFSCLSGSNDRFAISVQVTVEIDGKPQQIEGRFVRYDDERFDLSLTHPDYAMQLQRRADETVLVLPLHNTVYFGRGNVDPDDNLAPKNVAERLVSSGSTMSLYVPMIEPGNVQAAATLIGRLLKLHHDVATNRWLGENDDDLSLQFIDQGKSIRLNFGTTGIELQIGDAPASPEDADYSAMKKIELARSELERQLARGFRRTLEILTPSPMLTSPAPRARQVPHGELRWMDGQRVVLLHGTPEQIGRAHGDLLKVEASRCIDSVLYAFGTVQTVRTGRWFRHDLQAAYARLAPHIPDDHKAETRALASALAMDSELVESVNVFPELFHCSGFAVFGSATSDGKLYHGRVLDYMTTIGLQDAATTFIVAVDDKIPFANVGYAGCIGSVTGMNARAISLGEMGGGGEGQWDGVPMATLMRRALEECSTLDEVKQLWQDSPRTCEYYYVFADGKTNQTVGVAALPESIEFIQPGQSHARLGTGIQDAVVLSAGDRLEELRQRVQSRHGHIDIDAAKWFMSRPVAMQSNLHNVLFIPVDGVFYVANADHHRPAAECNYVRYDLKELLQSMNHNAPAALLPLIQASNHD